MRPPEAIFTSVSHRGLIRWLSGGHEWCVGHNDSTLLAGCVYECSWRRQTERQRQGQTHADRHTHRQTHTDRHAQTDTHKQTHRQKHTHTRQTSMQSDEQQNRPRGQPAICSPPNLPIASSRLLNGLRLTTSRAGCSIWICLRTE